MTDRAPSEQPAAAPEAAPDGGELASAELAALYIQQGEYERGIAMYQTLLEQNPSDPELRERLEDAEALADLLILRKKGKGDYRKGYREGYRQAVARGGPASREERISRLNAWLERVKERA
jgi:hypothetical protein